MSSNIILNKTHIANQNNNRLVYNFPRATKFGKDDTVAVSHFNVYFSWFNITAKYNNNFFQYKWWDMSGDLTQIIDVTIPDGFYSVNTLYEYIQSVMVQNGHYLETLDGGNYVYFIELLTNSTYYSVEWRLSSANSSMDFGSGLNPVTDYCKAPTTWALPSQFETPEIIIPSNNKFGELVGFNQGSNIYEDLTVQPSTNEKYSFLNHVAPNMLPSSSYIVTCNLVNNDLSIPNDVLYSFTIPNNVGFGDLISNNSDVIFSKIKEGTYTQLVLDIFDQDFNRLQISDPNMLVVLSVIKK